MEKRNDATQKNFERFIEQSNKRDIQGFLSDGAMVLTTDPMLYKLLLQNEEEKEQLQMLNTCGLRIDKNSQVASWFNHSIINIQPKLRNGYMEEDVGGNISLVLAKNINRLKDFIDAIICRHVKEFDIKMNDGYNNFNHTQKIPPFFASITRDNKFLDDVVCRTELELKNAAPLINGKLNRTEKNTNK